MTSESIKIGLSDMFLLNSRFSSSSSLWDIGISERFCIKNALFWGDDTNPSIFLVLPHRVSVFSSFLGRGWVRLSFFCFLFGFNDLPGRPFLFAHFLVFDRIFYRKFGADWWTLQKMYTLSVKQTYLAVFNSSASSAAVPGLATHPFSILLGARRSTQVTSQTNCFPSSQGAKLIPSGRFPSVRVRPYGSKIEGTLMELSACFTRVLRLWCLEKRPALLAQERP